MHSESVGCKSDGQPDIILKHGENASLRMGIDKALDVRVRLSKEGSIAFRKRGCI